MFFNNDHKIVWLQNHIRRKIIINNSYYLKSINGSFITKPSRSLVLGPLGWCVRPTVYTLSRSAEDPPKLNYLPESGSRLARDKSSSSCQPPTWNAGYWSLGISFPTSRVMYYHQKIHLITMKTVSLAG